MSLLNMLIVCVALGIVAAVMVICYRRFNSVWMLFIVVCVGVVVGVASSRTRYDGAEALDRAKSFPALPAFPGDDVAAISMVIVEWNIIWGTVAGSGASLATVALMLFFSRRRRFSNLPDAGDG